MFRSYFFFAFEIKYNPLVKCLQLEIHAILSDERSNKRRIWTAYLKTLTGQKKIYEKLLANGNFKGSLQIFRDKKIIKLFIVTRSPLSLECKTAETSTSIRKKRECIYKRLAFMFMLIDSHSNLFPSIKWV